MKWIYIPLIIILGGIIMIVASPHQPDERPVGYEYLENGTIIHWWNAEDDYYADVETGQQLSNHLGEWWATNTFCGYLINTIGNSKIKYCTDTHNFTWTPETDNSTYFRYTGVINTTTTLAAKQQKIQFKLEYYLELNDTNMTITPTMLNYGKNNLGSTAGFTWRIDDIMINNDTETDHFMIWNNTSQDFDWWMLNESLNLNFTNLDEEYLYVYDITGEHIWLDWENGTKYFLTVKSEKGQTNAPITLDIYVESLDKGASYSTTYHWVDALCSWSCRTVAPITDPDIGVGETYEQRGDWSGFGTRCPSSINVYAQYSNGTDFPSSGSNLITSDSNPQSKGNGVDAVWDVEGTEAGSYTVRAKCIHGITAKYGANKAVTVNAAPPEAECGTHHNINSNTFFSFDANDQCYTIIADDIIFDCDGHSIKSVFSGAFWVINVTGVNNITIKNCVIKNYGHGILFARSNNSLLWNNTFQNGSHINATNVNAQAIKLDTLVNMTINDTNISVLTSNSTFTADCYDGDNIGINILEAKYIDVNNLLMDNIAGQYSGDIDGDAGGCQQGLKDSGEGIYLSNTEYFSIRKGHLHNVVDDGIDIDSQINHTYIESFNISGGSSGIELSDVDNFTYYNGRVWNMSLRGIDITVGDVVNVSYTYLTNISGTALNLGGPTNLVVHNNLVEDCNGVHLEYNCPCTIENNVFQDGNDTLSVPVVKTGSSSQGSTFNNNTIKNFDITGLTGGSQNAGVHTSKPINVTSSTFENITRGITFHSDADDSQVWHSTFTDIPVADMLTALADHVDIYNCTFNKSNLKWYHSSQGSFIVYYYWRGNITDSDYVALDDANVTLYDTDDVQLLTEQTDASGLTSWYLVSEYNQTYNASYVEGCTESVSYIDCHTPHNMTATKDGYNPNQTTFTHDENQLVHLLLSSSQCWSLANKLLSIPTGCLYSQSGLQEI